MNRYFSIAIMLLVSASFAAAQSGATPGSDVLGAHLNYGRGCAGCHAPHSGSLGNGKAQKSGTDAGSVALWGEDASPLYGATIAFGAAKYTETLSANLGTGTPDVSGILMCLSCHDGNLATGAMMKNKVYEAALLPTTYGSNPIPTLLGNNGNSGAGAASYLTDHPVGTNAIIPCGVANHGWDCTYSATGGIIPGPFMAQFINNYGFFVSPSAINNQPAVMCTTCHNQHLMNVVAVSNSTSASINGLVGGLNGVKSGTSGLPAGNYATMFFIRAPYNPADPNIYTNQTAQFCRQCHGGESNELNGGTAVTVF